MVERLVLGDPDVGAVAALGHVQDRRLGHVLHEADAAGAEDAAVGHVEDVGTEVLDRVVALGVLGVAGAGPAFLEHVVLQLALAGLVADRAVERVVDEQQLEHALARLLGALGLLTCTTCPSATVVTQAGISLGAFSTSTRHMRHTAGDGSEGW